MKQKFFDEDWLKKTTTSLVGTVIGIILTFGTKACSTSVDKARMERRIVLLTTNDIDKKIKNLEKDLQHMRKQDSIYQTVTRLMPDSLSKLDKEELNLYANTFSEINFNFSSQSTENIFSNSFEVWQNFDDARVMGRIAECFNILGRCNDMYDKQQEEGAKLGARFWKRYMATTSEHVDIPKMVADFTSEYDTRIYMAKHKALIAFMEFFISQAERMQQLNKKALHISQKELDEINDLLEGDTTKYEINKSGDF